MAEYICPHCNNPTYDDEALLCFYCGDSLRRPVGSITKIRHPAKMILMIAAIIGLVISFITLVFY